MANLQKGKRGKGEDGEEEIVYCGQRCGPRQVPGAARGRGTGERERPEEEGAREEEAEAVG